LHGREPYLTGRLDRIQVLPIVDDAAPAIASLRQARPGARLAGDRALVGLDVGAVRRYAARDGVIRLEVDIEVVTVSIEGQVLLARSLDPRNDVESLVIEDLERGRCRYGSTEETGERRTSCA